MECYESKFSFPFHPIPISFWFPFLFHSLSIDRQSFSLGDPFIEQMKRLFRESERETGSGTETQTDRQTEELIREKTEHSCKQEEQKQEAKRYTHTDTHERKERERDEMGNSFFTHVRHDVILVKHIILLTHSVRMRREISSSSFFLPFFGGERETSSLHTSTSGSWCPGKLPPISLPVPSLFPLLFDGCINWLSGLSFCVIEKLDSSLSSSVHRHERHAERRANDDRTKLLQERWEDALFLLSVFLLWVSHGISISAWDGILVQEKRFTRSSDSSSRLEKQRNPHSLHLYSITRC